MAIGGHVRLYWVGTSEDYDIQAASNGDATFTINGDYERDFIAGTPFAVTNTASNNASYTSLGAVYYPASGQTIITVAAVPADQGVAGEITMNQCFVEFEFARWHAKFSKPALMDTDLYGIATRYEPVDSTKKQKFAISGVLVVDDVDMTLRSNAASRPTFWEILDSLAKLASTTFYIFHQETNQRGGSEFTIKRQYTGYIDDIDSLLDSLGSDEGARKYSIPFNLTADGTFTQLGSLASLSNRTRP